MKTQQHHLIPEDRQRKAVCCGGMLLFTLLVLLVLRRQPDGMTPDTETVFTSTRYVTSLAIAPDGTVWVGTMGGVLQRTPDGKWHKFTRLDGLPSNEVRHIDVEGGTITVHFPRGSAVRRGAAFVGAPLASPMSLVSQGAEQAGEMVGAPLASPALRHAEPEDEASLAPTKSLSDRQLNDSGRDGSRRSNADGGRLAEEPRPARQTCAAVWRGAEFVATVQGLAIHEGQRWHLVPLPPSPGTHISALMPHGDSLWAALFGDGLWSYDGRAWKRLDVGLSPEAREITTLAGNDKELWIGTRRAGVWERLGGHWIQHLQPNEPIAHNCQAVAMFAGKLFVSTLEDGLAVLTPHGWGHYQSPQISSDAPRQMVAYRDRLYLRHGSGKVDVFDGAHWQRDVCAGLPRRQATALAADAMRLYVAQWGGWSEFDGRCWVHHLNLPELQGIPITALCPDGATLWVGTQSRGVAEVTRTTGRLRWHDERAGLPDDWITVLARVGNSLYAGTFVGGLARWDGKRWAAAPELYGQNVTDLAPDASGGLFVATRTGVWHQAPKGKLTLLNKSIRFLDSEAQTLCQTPNGLWIGARTGLYFLPAL